MINELNENIIGIDFIHAHKLTYDELSRHVKFATFAALKQTILSAMTSTVVNAKYQGKADPKSTYVANICAPRTSMAFTVPVN